MKKSIATIIMCCNTVAVVQAGSIGGNATINYESKNSKIVTAEVSLADKRGGGGKDTRVGTIFVDSGGKIKGNATVVYKSTDDLVVGGETTHVGSIVVK